jgi:hypothetical protein
VAICWSPKDYCLKSIANQIKERNKNTLHVFDEPFIKALGRKSLTLPAGTVCIFREISETDFELHLPFKAVDSAIRDLATTCNTTMPNNATKELCNATLVYKPLQTQMLNFREAFTFTDFNSAVLFTSLDNERCTIIQAEPEWAAWRMSAVVTVAREEKGGVVQHSRVNLSELKPTQAEVEKRQPPQAEIKEMPAQKKTKHATQATLAFAVTKNPPKWIKSEVDILKSKLADMVQGESNGR